MHLGDLVADIREVALDLGECRIKVRQQRVHRRVREVGHEPEVRSLVGYELLDNRPHRMALAVTGIFVQHAREQADGIGHFRQGAVELPNDRVGLAGGAIDVIDGGLEVVGRVVDDDDDIAEEGRQIVLRQSGKLRVERVHHGVQRRREHGLEEVPGILAQRLLQLVQADRVERRAQGGPHRIGDRIQRPVQLVGRVVEEIERLDARQLQADVLREVEVNFAGREFLESAVDVDHRQDDRRVLEAGEFAQRRVPLERVIEEGHLDPIPLRARMI